jgi:outer membrane protein assembly factor BamB
MLLRTGFAAGDTGWTQFRGSNGQGIAADAKPPLTWSDTNNIVWKVPTQQHGRSSPIVLGDRIWLTTSVEKNVERKRIGPDDMQTASNATLGASCFSARDGKLLWHVTLFEVDKPQPVHFFNSWATPTPVIEKDRLYCDFGTFGTACLEADTGKVVWKLQVPLDHQVGPGSSPILYENLLILVRDGRDAQFVTALDKNTGKAVWKTNRPPINAGSGSQKKSFGTPMITRMAEKIQMITVGAHWLVSYDPVSGGEFWRFKHGQGFSLSSIPMVRDKVVYFGTGCFAAELLAVQPDGKGELSNSNLLWRIKGQIPIMSIPLLHEDKIYCVADNGTASCIDTKDGSIVWRKQIAGMYLASPVYAAGRIYFFNQKGRTTVLKAGQEFEVLAENHLEVEGDLVATPAFAGKSIFLRTDGHLYRIEQQ